MRHREQIIPPLRSSPDLTSSGNQTVALCMSQFMLCSGSAETPPIFLDRDGIQKSLSSALEYAAKTNNLKESVESLAEKIGISEQVEISTGSFATINELMGDFTATTMNSPLAAIITFSNGNSVTFVGSGNTFYVIDPSNHIFVSTNAPEYDIRTYIEDYGTPEFSTCLVKIREVVPQKKEELSKVEAKPAPKKKTKTEVPVKAEPSEVK